jgi:hypothetical protein
LEERKVISRRLLDIRFILVLSMVAMPIGKPIHAGFATTLARKYAFENISFACPKTLATKIEQKTVAAVKLESPDDKPDGVAPEHLELKLTPSGTMVYLYPLQQKPLTNEQYVKLYPTVADAGRVLKKSFASAADKSIEIPFLPWQDAATPFTAQRKKLATRNGQAWRYVAEYLIEPDVIDSERLVYSAQGVSTDGRWYVSVVAPIKTKALPAKSDLSKWPRPKADKFSTNFDAYARTVGARLEKLPATAYTPDLSTLDSFVQSIALGSSGAVSVPASPGIIKGRR